MRRSYSINAEDLLRKCGGVTPYETETETELVVVVVVTDTCIAPLSDMDPQRRC